MPRFLNAALLGAALIAPVAIAPTTLRAQDQKTAASTTTNNTMTIMNGTVMKIRRIVCVQKRTIANIAIFPSSKTTINKHTGAGVTNIQTPCSRSTYTSPITSILQWQVNLA